MNETVLRVENVHKHFAGVKALDDVSIDIRAHEVTGVIGENGSGKTTLLKVLAGIHQVDGGRIVLRGQATHLRSVSDAAREGIGMVHQEQSLLPNLRVAENILLGHENAALRAGLYDWNALYALAAAQLDKLNSSILPSAQTDRLSFSERQVVELAKVLAMEEHTQHEPIMLLDEPTSMLDIGQIETFLTYIERLRGRASIVFVSHRLNEVLRVCERIYVMRGGRCVAYRERGNTDVAELQYLMLGHSLDSVNKRQAPADKAIPSSVALSVRALSRPPDYRGISFDLRAGEVLGLAGTEGSGRESLCRTLFGAEAPDSGDILFDGQPIQLGEPADAARIGIAYVPAERAESIIAGLSVRKNMTLAQLDGLCHGPFIDLARERSLVKRWIDRLHIKPSTPRTLAAHLSGGNQQKVVLAKWMIARKPRIMILDRPLRGLDVGAKTEMIALIREVAASGIGIVLVADTHDELIALSDSIIVMKDGVLSGCFPASAEMPSDRQILKRMI